MKVLLATSNPHKLREVRPVLAEAGIEVVGFGDLDADVEEPVEDGETFEENARIKARGYAAQLSMTCLAEDSGLEVDALGGAPGVRSARYAGASGSRAERDHANNDALLAALADVPEPERTARFVCVMCMAEPGGRIVAESRGTYEGLIAQAPRGDGGFGYDPLLYLPDRRCTSAELSPEDKNARSHRGQAARALARALRR